MAELGGIRNLRKLDERGILRTTGYKVMIPDVTRPKMVNGRYHYIVKRFSRGEKSLAESWYRQERAYLIEQKSKGEKYVPRIQREEKSRLLDVTFSQYARQWVAEYRSPVTGQRPAPATMRQTTVRVGHLIDFFTQVKGDEHLADITARDCMECGEWLLKKAPDKRRHGRPGIGAVATGNAMRKLKALLRDAAQPIDGVRPALIDRNPCENVPMPRFPKSRQAEIPAATPAELEAIYNAMPGYDRIFVYICALCGLRISEVCALQVRDVDLDATDEQGNQTPMLHVRHALSRDEGDVGSFHLAPTKNETSHATVPIASARLVSMLRAQIKNYTDGKPDSMLIPAPKGGVMSPNSLRSQFDAVRDVTHRKERGIPELHTHTLRATHDNEFAINSPNEKIALKGTRRATMDVYIDRYQRTTAEAVRDAQKKTDDALLPPSTPDALRMEIASKRKKIQNLEADVRNLESRLAAYDSSKQSQK